MEKYVYLIENIEGTLGVFDSIEQLKIALSKYDKNDYVFEHHSEVSRWTLNSMDREYIARTKDLNANTELVDNGWFKGEKYL